MDAKRLFFLLFPAILTGYAGCRQSGHQMRGRISASAMTVSAHPLASKAGNEIMKQGGNAIDAAVAVEFALAVVYPVAGNIGGGGFMVCRMHDGQSITLDFREKAPQLASRDMYLDEDGKVTDGLSTRSHLATGVPGTVDGMVAAYEKYGTLPWKELIRPAIELAGKGFPLTQSQAENLNVHREDFRELNTVLPDHILCQEWHAGDTLRQEALAETLKLIRDSGRAGFYEGTTADLLTGEMKRGRGLITQDDLRQYSSVWRKPVKGSIDDLTIISMGPPSSGGIALIQLTTIISRYRSEPWAWSSVPYLHTVIEAEKRVYADRAEYLGDPDFFDIPDSVLTGRGYLDRRMASFNPEKATPAGNISAGRLLPAESTETTHFSIVDPQGNAVSVTTTLNGAYGSKIMVAGAGFFLNNEMDDFSIKPGYPNMFGLIGGEVNAISPVKGC